MALNELIGAYDVLNTGRIKINQWYSGTSAIWSSSTGTDSVIRSNANGNLGNNALGLNSIAAGVRNRASGNFSMALWGTGNTATTLFSTVVSGRNNKSTGAYSIVSGGFSNSATSTYNTIGGGKTNITSASYSSIVGGVNNRASGAQSSIGGGNSNLASGSFSSIGGGFSNETTATTTTIAGGTLNKASGQYSSILGGNTNLAPGSFATVGAGYLNAAVDDYSFVGGGYRNSASTMSAIVGGSGNTINSSGGFIGGGKSNSMSTGDNYGSILGGKYNTIGSIYSLPYASIAGGLSNTISSYGARGFIGGGSNNSIQAANGATVGSKGCRVANAYSVVIGGGGHSRATFDFILGATNTTTPNVSNNTIRLQGTGGNIKMDGSVTTPEADYAEYFEWKDGNTQNEERLGYFVSLDGDKINIGNENVIGIISSTPSIIGDGAPNKWSGMYKKNMWGQKIKAKYKKFKLNGKNIFVDDLGIAFFEYPNPSNPKGIVCSETNIIIPEKYEIESFFEMNPNFDVNAPYFSREERPEWSPVGLLGKILVRTQEKITSKFVDANENGMAINGTKYPVMDIVKEYDGDYGIIKILFR